MNYPFWDSGIAYGILMAVIAIPHVFVSHFAIGGGLYLVVSERAARRKDDTARLEFLQRLSKFFILVTLVFGALTGVGIWFIIGLLNPAATEVLIHNFVWGWATEWTFFVVEIAAAILYYYGWKRMSPRDHMLIGWIYFAAAWLSLFIINGIITFMLTPGEWLTTGAFWDGFFNPTFWPSLFFRTGISLLLAGLYALVVASRYPAVEFKAALVRQNARWSFFGLAVMAPSFYWYWAAIPTAVTEEAARRMPIPMASIHYCYWLAAAIALLLAVFGLLLPRRFTLPLALAGMALGLGWFGTFEWFRESIRKPYVISGYMYGNALEVGLSERYQSAGLLAAMSFRSGDDGSDLFHRACGSCHTIDGYNGLNRIFGGTDRQFIQAVVRQTQRLKGNMPPFPGTAEEAGAIAGYLESRIDARGLSEVYGLQGRELGRRVYEIRCGTCHAIGTADDKLPQLRDLGEQDLGNLLDMAADLGEGMPAFTASDEERRAMIEFLTNIGDGGAK